MGEKAKYRTLQADIRTVYIRVLLEVKDSEWAFLAELLKKFEFVRIQRTEKTGKEAIEEMPLTFKATQLNTVDFKFNREEANER